MNPNQPNHTQRHAQESAAAEQLYSPAAPVRTAAVKTLVTLADDWLADEHVPAEQAGTRVQGIINTLCEYIRSPYAGTDRYLQLTQEEPDEALSTREKRQFYADQAHLVQEGQVRQSILAAIIERVRWVGYVPQRYTYSMSFGTADEETVIGGPWSGFDYDFSGADFFYPVHLAGAFWGGRVTARNATWRDNVFMETSVFNGDASFSGGTYLGKTIYVFGCIYRGNLDRSHCTYGAVEGNYHGYTHDLLLPVLCTGVRLISVTAPTTGACAAMAIPTTVPPIYRGARTAARLTTAKTGTGRT